jgi:predicted ABC-type ATPase
MIAGPNGSGKTILIRQLLASGVDLGRHISPDEIATTLEGDYDDRVRRAQAIADGERDRCIRDGTSFSFETVMSHPSKIELLQQAKDSGFRVGMYFVATELVELNVARVAQRVALGGHDVPEAKIRERYERCFHLLPAAIEIADDATLFDNSFGPTDAMPATFRPFARLVDGELTLSTPIPHWARRTIGRWLDPFPR